MEHNTHIHIPVHGNSVVDLYERGHVHNMTVDEQRAVLNYLTAKGYTVHEVEEQLIEGTA